MKRTLSLLLCVIMIAVTLAGCAKKDEEDKGAIIPVYFGTEVVNFDPAYALHDEQGLKVLGLLNEGLTYIDSNGKLQKAIAKSWKAIERPDENYYMLQIELKDTKWSDGRIVSADDFVFAWKRLLEPEFASEAASMLYEIKNARAVKNGDMTIDDLGLYAADTTVLQVEFETKIDYDLFMEYCASPALVPLREDIVVKLADWASNPSTMVNNGPFTIKSYKAGESMTFERNVYYYRDVDAEESIFKYVEPYRFEINFTMDAEAQLSQFDEGSIFYINDIPLTQRSAKSSEAKIQDMLTAHTYVLNTKKAPFDKKEVRQALSLAVDRNALVQLVTYAKASEGIVTNGVFETTSGTSFRTAGGALISASADMSKAKSLLSSAGVSSGSFKISIRPNNPVDRAVADYLVGVWGQLGFTVSVVELGTEYYTALEYDQYADLFEKAYRSSDFDVIAIDMTMLSTDPFVTLAMFSYPFSGGAMNLASGDFSLVPHVSGYKNEAYDALIEEIYAEKTRAGRVSKLHEAEKMLVDDMPVIPLFEYQDAYLVSGELSNIKSTYYGTRIFNKTKLKDYLQYQTTVAEDAAEETAAEETVAE